ncbi:DUF5057 domain-containing protein [Paenibacillus sp. FSL P4-0338]|uniref:DUF5057 domain-containing protein n=1 Tax=unclassified Paenibacillus TaxID=185978 RepID=UPI0003E21D35|nr:DUF5057 domain-containing protein [Paenibacillus sp. FSL R7-269]ETT49997.1 Ig domain-containing protein [Paenibacillus sp. FSL R7-269]
MMKHVKERKLLFFPALILVTLLLILTARHLMIDVFAGNTEYKPRILEITESGASDFKTSGISSSVMDIDTVSMKRFIALHDDLDGKYDAIYIGKGLYDKKGIQDPSVITEASMNDITQLKANEIVDEFINKGLYVFLHSAPFLNQTTAQHGVLYNTFNIYRTKSLLNNVVFVNDNELAKLAAELSSSESKYTYKLKQRPHLTISNRTAIKDYGQNSHLYKAGDTLSFNINVANVEDIAEHPVFVKLLLSEGIHTFTEDTVVASMTVNKNSDNILSYKLPATYSGLLHWKLEITESSSGQQLKDYETGAIRYRKNSAAIRVLQVGTGITLPDYLKNSEDYQLSMTSMSATEFNNYVSTKDTSSPKYGLNSVYDELVVNFSDIYKTSSPLTSAAIAAVKEYADTKQGVIYLFDTTSSNSDNWTPETLQTIGQQNPALLASPGAANQSANIIAVNGFLQAQYPFYTSEIDGATGILSSVSDLSLSGSKNSSFTLNLEDNDVIPWYNFAADSQDKDDSYNHYFAYSKGNSVYLSNAQLFTGSTPDIWNKLLVNAIHHNYISSNHAPVITVDAPASEFPAYQKQFVLKYSAKDPEHYDTNLITSVKFKVNGSYLTDITFDDTAIKSGDSIYRIFPNPLPSGGTLQIEISAMDGRGAVSTKLLDVSVTQTQLSTANLDIRKRISSSNMTDGKIGVNETFSMEYSVLPVSIKPANLSATDSIASSLEVSDVKFEDILPPNIAIVDPLPDGVSSTGTASSGITISKKLGSITYKPDPNNNGFFDPQTTPIVITVNLKVTAAGKYSLAETKLNFEDLRSVVTATATPTPTVTTTATATATVIPTVAPTVTPAPAATFNPSISTTNSPFGVAGDYNVFVLQNFTFSNDGIKGNVAAGGDVNLTESININTENGTSVPYAIVAGGNYNSPSNQGGVSGRVLHGGPVPDKDTSTITRGTLIDFSSTATYLTKISKHLATQFKTDDYKLWPWNTLDLIGTNGTLNVFTLPANVIDNANPVNIKVPNNSSVLINVLGTSSTLKGNTSISGVDENNIVYNFPEATTLTLSSGPIKGTVLAPLADITGTSGTFQGQIIGKSFTGRITIGKYTYVGALPTPSAAPTATPIPTPSPTATPTPSPTPVPTPIPRVFVSFPSIHLEAVTKVSAIELDSDDTTIYLGESRKLTATVTPTDATNQRLEWDSDSPGTVSVDLNNGVVSGLALGSANITVKATDTTTSNRPSKKIKVTVINRPVIDNSVPTTPTIPTLELIGGDNPVIIGDRVSLEAIYSPANDPKIGYRWDHSGGELEAGNDELHKTYIPQQSGAFTIKVEAFRLEDGVTILTATKDIKVTNPATSIEIKGETEILTGTAIYLNLAIFPNDADPLKINDWEIIAGNEYATLTKVSATKYILKANMQSGSSVTVRATAGSLSDEHIINIIGLESLSFNTTDEVTILVGQSEQLLPRLYTHPSSIKINDIANNLAWSNENNDILSLNPNTGQIRGLSPGNSVVTVNYKGSSISAQIRIKVVEETGDRY